jgi:hypothetical protein
MARNDQATQRNWVFAPYGPVLDVEVSVLAAPNATTDWVHGPRRDEAIKAIVDRCASLFGEEIGGRVEHVRHSVFNHHGMTIHLNIAAHETEQLEGIVARDLSAFERSLESAVQTHLGWEQAAVSVQIETNPAYEGRRARHSKPRPGNPDDINVWQPGGGNNAIAPVIVTVPTPGHGADANPIHTLPYPPPPVRQSSAAVAGLFGALLAIGVAIMVALMIGPLTNEISYLNNQQDIVQNELTLRDQEITSLNRENGRLQDTVSRLASRRGQPAARSDQPTRTLPDTGPSSPLASTTPSISSSSAGAP